MIQRRGRIVLCLRIAFWATVVGGLGLVALYMTSMPGESHAGPLPELSDEERRFRENLKRHVAVLGREIGERNVWHPAALNAAAAYIKQSFTEFGFEVGEQSFQAEGQAVANLEAVLPSMAASPPAAEAIVIGAHYDSVVGSPGANDNGSGVAAMLEIARFLAGRRFRREVRFVAFVNEEPPFFYTDQMGSRRYARRAAKHGERIAAMLSLETIGYYADEQGSQRYPFPFGLFYPDRGNFIGFVGNLRSGRLVREAIGSFRRHTRFPSEGTTAPGWLTGIGWSDHWSFWKEGYPAVMVTDTAPFRYPAYHTAADRPEMLDYDRLCRVVAGLARVVIELADGKTGPG